MNAPERIRLTEFSHGPVETLAMTLTSWMLPRKYRSARISSYAGTGKSASERRSRVSRTTCAGGRSTAAAIQIRQHQLMVARRDLRLIDDLVTTRRPVGGIVLHPAAINVLRDQPRVAAQLHHIDVRLAESIGPIPTFYLTAEYDLDRVSELRTAMSEMGDEYKVSFNDIESK